MVEKKGKTIHDKNWILDSKLNNEKGKGRKLYLFTFDRLNISKVPSIQKTTL